MMPSTSTIRIEMGTASPNAPVPAASSVNRIASVAYATEDRLSLENTARALTLDSRSSPSSSVRSGRPKARRRIQAAARPTVVAGMKASGRATTTPGSRVVRKYGERGSSIWTRRSAGRRPAFSMDMGDRGL